MSELLHVMLLVLLIRQFVKGNRWITHLCLKIHVEDSVSFIHNQVLESSQVKALCVFQVVNQTAWCCYEETKEKGKGGRAWESLP